MTQIQAYYQQNYNYCPRCSAKFPNKNEPLHCTQCGFEIYANPAPTTAILIEKNGKLLLAKRKIDPKKGAWDTPGGFVECDETIEESAIREAKEETGLKIKVLKIIGSQPDIYDQKPTLTFAIHAKIIEGTMKAADDVASLYWVDFANIPQEFGFESVTKLVHQFVKNIKN